MQLIETYIFRRIAVMTLSTMVIVTTIVLTTQLLNRITMVTQSAEAFLAFLSIALHLVPSMVMIVIPFALLVGIMRTLNAMNADSELAVLEASGRSPAATARPALLMTLILTAASLFIAHVAEPAANRNVREAIIRASTNLVRAAANVGTFTPIYPGTYIQITEQLPGGDFGRVVLVDTRDTKTELVYHAKRGSLVEAEGVTVLVLVDGEVHRRNRSDNNVSIISFASTALDLGQFAFETRAAQDRPQEMSTPALFAPDPNNVAAQDAPAEIRREIHRRMTEWLYPLVFGLVAIYFTGTARSNRQQRPVLVISGGAIALLLRTAGFITVGSSGNNPVMAALSYAVPLGAIIVLSGLILSDDKVGTGRIARGPLARIYDRSASLLTAVQRAVGVKGARGTNA